jgi:hypothetical protein
VALLVDWAAKELASMKPPTLRSERRPLATRDKARPRRAKKPTRKPGRQRSAV